jgi:hypothetical protein
VSGAEVALHGDDQRALDRLMARARIIAAMPGLKKEIAGDAHAVGAIMLSLDAYGLPATIPGINDAFDWIEGRAAPSAHLYQGLAYHNGYSIVPVERTAERAVARIENPFGAPATTVEFTIEMAADAHRLDEWVEKWNQTDRGKSYPTKLVVRVNGQRVNEPWPDWATALVDSGQVKRFDAWWNYRTDMLWKSAAKRAVKIACPHVLLGDIVDHALVSPAAASAPAGPVGETGPLDDGVIDAEVVDDPLPASPPPSGEGPPAKPGTRDPDQGDPPGAHHAAKTPRMGPVRELFEVHGEGLDPDVVRTVIFSCTNGTSDKANDMTLSAYGIAVSVLAGIRAGRWPTGWDDVAAQYQTWLNPPQQTTYGPDEEPF